MEIPREVSFIIETLNESGYEAFVVGGCVRDSIMEKVPKDFDIATSAIPEQIKPLFEKTVDTGIKHGTITIVLKEGSFEVTTYRIDGEYKDCRRPTEVFFTNYLADDLMRRDFTINAIAYHKETGFVDPYDGIKDIKDRKIRGVGEPTKRFNEDALRMLRCIRFSTQLGFDVEKETYKSLMENTKLISKISTERIRDELCKIFLGEDLNRSILLTDSKIISHVNLELSNYLDDYLEKSICYMKRADEDIVDRLVILFRYADDKRLLEFMRFLKFSNEATKTVCTLRKYLDIEINNDLYSVRKMMSILGYNLFLKLINIKEILGESTKQILLLSKNILENKDPLTLKDLNINGNILKNNKICENKQIGEILNLLLDHVLQDISFNTEEKLLELAKSMKLK